MAWIIRGVGTPCRLFKVSRVGSRSNPPHDPSIANGGLSLRSEPTLRNSMPAEPHPADFSSLLLAVDETVANIMLLGYSGLYWLDGE